VRRRGGVAQNPSCPCRPTVPLALALTPSHTHVARCGASPPRTTPPLRRAPAGTVAGGSSSATARDATRSSWPRSCSGPTRGARVRLRPWLSPSPHPRPHPSPHPSQVLVHLQPVLPPHRFVVGGAWNGDGRGGASAAPDRWEAGGGGAGRMGRRRGAGRARPTRQPILALTPAAAPDHHPRAGALSPAQPQPLPSPTPPLVRRRARASRRPRRRRARCSMSSKSSRCCRSPCRHRTTPRPPTPTRASHRRPACRLRTSARRAG